MLRILPYIFLASLLAKLSGAQSLHTVEGIYQNVVLHNVDTNGWQFRSSDGQSIAPKHVVRWGAWQGIREEQAVWLTDGSWICGDVSFEANGDLTVKSDWLDDSHVPLSAVRGLILNPPASQSAWRDMQTELLSASGDQDILWLAARRKLSGIIRWPRDGLTGDPLILATRDKEIEFATEEVRAAVFSPALLGPPPETPNGLTIGLKDGSLLRIRELQIVGGKVQIKLRSGLTITSLDEAEGFASSVRYIADTPAKVINLADMPVASYKHVSRQTLRWSLGVNRDVYGRPLTAQNGQIARGLAMHSASRVAFRWDGTEGRLLAEVVFARSETGADRGLGSVTCKILLARDGRLEQATQFAISRSGSKRSSIIDVDISGVQLIVLITEQADFAQSGDHILFLNARIAQ